MTPFSSVAMLEKLALLKIALCNAPALSSASSARLRAVTSFWAYVSMALGSASERRRGSVPSAASSRIVRVRASLSGKAGPAGFPSVVFNMVFDPLLGLHFRPAGVLLTPLEPLPRGPRQNGV